MLTKHAGVGQWLDRNLAKVDVMGSIPIARSNSSVWHSAAKGVPRPGGECGVRTAPGANLPR